MPISAHDFTEKTKGTGICFGASGAAFANALRQLAARIESGEVLPQSATVRSRAMIDEFTTTHIMLVVFEKVPPGESSEIGNQK